MSQSAVALSKHICLQQCLKMFVADVRCPYRPRGRLFQIRGPTAPKLLSPKLLCVRGTAHRVRPKGSSVAFGDEMDVISQVDRHSTAQCLARQTVRVHRHSESRCTMRSQMDPQKVSSPATQWKVDDGSRGKTDHMNSVSAAFSCRRFDAVQRVTDSMQASISWQNDAELFGVDLRVISSELLDQTTPQYVSLQPCTL